MISSMCNGLFRHKANRPENPRRQRLQMLHILRHEFLSVSQIQQPIIRQRTPGERIDRRIGNFNLQTISTRMKKRRQIDPIRRPPNRPSLLPVH